MNIFDAITFSKRDSTTTDSGEYWFLYTKPSLIENDGPAYILPLREPEPQGTSVKMEMMRTVGSLKASTEPGFFGEDNPEKNIEKLVIKKISEMEDVIEQKCSFSPDLIMAETLIKFAIMKLKNENISASESFVVLSPGNYKKLILIDKSLNVVQSEYLDDHTGYIIFKTNQPMQASSVHIFSEHESFNENLKEFDIRTYGTIGKLLFE